MQRGHRPVLRILVILLLTTGTLLLLSAILTDVHVKNFASALGSAALIGLVNALIWPLVIRFALPLTVLTLGLGVVVLNGAMVLLVAAIDPGLTVDSLFAGIVVALTVTIVNTAATSLLAIDDDEFWYRNVVRRQAKRTAKPETTDVPGLFFLEIDGLAHDVLLRAIRDGNAPTMAAGCATAPTGWRDGKPTGPHRPAPARPGCCTATTTTCRRSAGGRRTRARRSSRTTRATRWRSSGATRTAAGCCSRTAPAARTSSRATRCTACSR